MTPRRGDAGFTLVELLLAMTLLGLLAGPLVGAIFVVLRNSAYTLDKGPSRGTAQDQLTTSHDQQLLDAVFGADVQSSESVTATRPACLPALAGTTSVVSFTWSDSSGGAVERLRSAWYYLSPSTVVAGVPQLRQLHRRTCAATPAAPATALPGSTEDAVVSRAVGSATPTVTCDGGALPCTATTRIVAVQVRLGVDVATATVFGAQGQRRLVTS